MNRRVIGWPADLEGTDLLVWLALRDLHRHTPRHYYARDVATVAGFATSTVQQRLRGLAEAGHARKRVGTDRALCYTPVTT